MTLVRLTVSPEVLLRAWLRLPENVTLEGASTTGAAFGNSSLSLAVEMPDAPEGAASVDLTYLRLPGPDPVQLTGMRWLREDGSEIRPQLVSGAEPG